MWSILYGTMPRDMRKPTMPPRRLVAYSFMPINDDAGPESAFGVAAAPRPPSREALACCFCRHSLYFCWCSVTMGLPRGCTGLRGPLAVAYCCSSVKWL